MKVAFVSRENLFSSPGGDTVQMIETAKGLKALGCEVHFFDHHSGKEFFKDFQIVHFFNIIRPSDLLPYLEFIKCPIVVSPIYVDYHESDLNSRKGIGLWLVKNIGKFNIELLKVGARIIKGSEKNISFSFFWDGYKKSIRKILSRSSFLLPNSGSELSRFIKDFPQPQVPALIIPNGVDLEALSKVESGTKENVIVCAGRIEKRKNQLSLIEATRGLDVDLILVGKQSPNQKDYYDTCKRLAHERVTFIEHLPQEELFKIFAKAKVHALVSWFETTGLVSLEACYLNCSLVITKKGDQLDYFEDYASYCDPGSISSIRKAITEALELSPSEALKKKIEDQCNWENTAKMTYSAYLRALNNKTQNQEN